MFLLITVLEKKNMGEGHMKTSITEEKLQIILITYNREKHVKRTFDAIFADSSPVRGCDILVLDNNSTDGTGKYVKELMRSHPRLSYRKNKYNLGGCGNIARAMESAEKEYYWIISDDDLYDWSSWLETEDAMTRDEDVIIIARYGLPDAMKDNIATQLLQATFVPGSIVKTALLNDVVMRNVMDNIYTLFPHLCPLISLLNQKKKFYVVSKGIVDNGWDRATTDSSYTRGLNSNDLFPKTVKMSWMLGYAGICSGIQDKTTHESVFVNGFRDGFDKFCEWVNKKYNSKEDYLIIEELAMALSEEHRAIFRKRIATN